MHVNFNMNPAGRSTLTVNTIMGAAQQNKAQTNPMQRKDKTDISPQGKMMNMIENLTKQKENVMQQKSDLMTQTLEKGKSMESIEVQLELFDEKLSNLDEQIEQVQTNMMQSMLDQAKESVGKKKDKEETEEQADAKHLNNIAAAADGTKQAETVATAKRKVQSEINVKNSENKLAEIEIDRLKSKGVNVAPMVSHAKKALKEDKAEVSDLRVKLGELEKMQGDAIAGDTEKLDELRAESIEKSSAQEQEKTAQRDGETEFAQAAAE